MAFDQLFDGLPLAARPTTQVVETLAKYGAPIDEGLQMMASDWPSQAVHAVLQATSLQYRRMRKAYKQEAVERLKAAGWTLGPEDIAERLGYNLLIVLTCKTRGGPKAAGAGSVGGAGGAGAAGLSRMPVSTPEKPGKPWIVLATDGSGLLWHAVADKHRMYLLPWQTGSVLNASAVERSCRVYKPGALVGYEGTTWRVIAVTGDRLQVEDTKNSARQAVVSVDAIETARPPAAESVASIGNRAEEVKRRASGAVEAYTSVEYALGAEGAEGGAGGAEGPAVLQALIDAEE